MKEAKKVWSDTMGSYALMICLTPHVGETAAHEAVEGWRGDRFEFWESPGGNLKTLLGRVEFDTEGEAGKFFEAFAQNQLRRFQFESVLEKDGHIQWLKTSRDEACTYLEWVDKGVWVIEGLDPSQTSAVREILLKEQPTLTQGDHVITF